MSNTGMILYYLVGAVVVFGGLVALPMWWNDKLKDPEVKRYLKERHEQRMHKHQPH